MLKETGLGNEALPLTVAVGGPASAVVLYLYTKSIKRLGSRLTLRLSNIFCLLMFFFMFLYCGRVKGLTGKIVVVFFYALREIYVSLLSSQQWAFISTTLDKSTASYLVSFSGVVSVASAIGGCTVEQLVEVGGVRGLLFTALAATVVGSICAETASTIVESDAKAKAAEQQKEIAAAGCSPTAATDCVQTKSTSNEANASQVNANIQSNSSSNHHSHAVAHQKKKGGFWRDSWNLVRSHTILQLLFFEAVTHQTCTNMLNIMFHNGLRTSTVPDDVKAKLVGRFFASVNITACLAQCFVLPSLLSQASLPKVLKQIPFIVLAAVMIGVFYPGLISVMLGFGTMKVLEYSIMHSASEMIYMPLGHELRYVGKELVKFFGHKLGKSGASLALSFLLSHFKPSLTMQSIWGAIFIIAWAVSIYMLSAHLSERDEMSPRAVRAAPISVPAAVKGPSTSATVKTAEAESSNQDLNIPTSRSMAFFEVPEDESSDSSKDGINSRNALNIDDETTTTESETPPNFWYNAETEDSPRDSMGRSAYSTESLSSLNKSTLKAHNLRHRALQGSAASGKYSRLPKEKTVRLVVETAPSSGYYGTLTSWVDSIVSSPYVQPFIPTALKQNNKMRREKPLMLQIGSVQVGLDSLDNARSRSNSTSTPLKASLRKSNSIAW